MSKINEKREILQTEVWKKEKKDVFKAIFQIIDTTAFCNKSLCSTV